MEVTREIVIDLLPLYESGEASADTRAAVEQFLRHDPALARLHHQVEDDRANGGTEDAVAGATLERQAVERTRAVIRRRGWTLALAVFFSLTPFTFAFSQGHVTFFMFRDEPGTRLFLVAAVWLWVQYVLITRRLRTAGL
jgi:anti-sigma factor RsiW